MEFKYILLGVAFTCIVSLGVFCSVFKREYGVTPTLCAHSQTEIEKQNFQPFTQKPMPLLKEYLITDFLQFCGHAFFFRNFFRLVMN